MNEDALLIVKKHHGKLLSQGEFFETFYDFFLQSSPEVAERFEGVDLENQMKLLRHGLNLMVMHVDDNIAGTSGLSRIKQTHSPSKMDIQPHLYEYWKNSFLKAIQAVDPEVSSEVLAAWDTLLQKGIAFVSTARDEAE